MPNLRSTRLRPRNRRGGRTLPHTLLHRRRQVGAHQGVRRRVPTARRPVSIKIVAEAYADCELDRQCTNCGAPPSIWCTRPEGRLRALPCLARTAAPEGRTLRQRVVAKRIVAYCGGVVTGLSDGKETAD